MAAIFRAVYWSWIAGEWRRSGARWATDRTHIREGKIIAAGFGGGGGPPACSTCRTT